MGLAAHVTDDPAHARATALDFLVSRPVEHNVVLTLLADRIASGQRGRYWWVEGTGGAVCGFAMRSPREFWVAPVPMAHDVVDVLVDAMCDDPVPIPGVTGEPATVARFAGRWTEVTGGVARPREGQRLYRLGALREAEGVPGELRLARPREIDLLTGWADAFERDTKMPSPGENRSLIEARVRAQRLWVWEHEGPACMAVATAAIAGVCRVGFVYTPDERRGRGYAAACVGRLSRHLLDTEADTCCLFTQLANPTSNGVYRRLGYEAIGEILAYELQPGIT